MRDGRNLVVGCSGLVESTAQKCKCVVCLIRPIRFYCVCFIQEPSLHFLPSPAFHKHFQAICCEVKFFPTTFPQNTTSVGSQ